jgi:hypothetical protein
MKASLFTTLFYIASTTPSFSQYTGLPLLKTAEAQAWSTVLLTSGLVYGTYSNRWLKVAETRRKEEEEKSE